MVVPLVASGTGHDPVEVRETARRILEGSPFREAAPSPVNRAVERLLELVGEVIGRALSVVGAGTAIAWTIVAVSALVLLVAVWRWTRGVRLEPTVEEESADPGGLPASHWNRSADEAEERGDLATALRHRYLAVVANLEERDIVEPSPGRTIRELDRELEQHHPVLHPPIAAAGARVEQVAYGGEPASPEDVEVARAALDVVTTEVGVLR